MEKIKALESIRLELLPGYYWKETMGIIRRLEEVKGKSKQTINARKR